MGPKIWNEHRDSGNPGQVRSPKIWNEHRDAGNPDQVRSPKIWNEHRDAGNPDQVRSPKIWNEAPRFSADKVALSAAEKHRGSGNPDQPRHPSETWRYEESKSSLRNLKRCRQEISRKH